MQFAIETEAATATATATVQLKISIAKRKLKSNIWQTMHEFFICLLRVVRWAWRRYPPAWPLLFRGSTSREREREWDEQRGNATSEAATSCKIPRLSQGYMPWFNYLHFWGSFSCLQLLTVPFICVLSCSLSLSRCCGIYFFSFYVFFFFLCAPYG